MFYKGNIPIISDDPATNVFAFPDKPVERGYVPRDYSVDPQEMFSSPSEMELIDESEWDARYDEQEAQQSSLEHIYLNGPATRAAQTGTPAFVNLDQNGNGYCWSYSVHQAVMMARLRDGMRNVRLNPHAVAAIIKGGRDEGGWCGLSAKFVRENGCAEEGTGPGQWPLHSRSLTYNTAACKASMALYKTTEDFVDLTKAVYDQNLTTKQRATQSFLNNPGPDDYNWWGHSVCRIRWVRIERGSWGPLILNSWLNWGRYGLAVLQGTKAVANGSLSIVNTRAT